MMIGGDNKATPRAALAECWSCKGPVSIKAMFCHTCGAIQPPRQSHHFSRLGFEPDFDIDLDLLEKRYLGFQRSVHPDRFATKPAKERAMAEQQSVSLNQAFETLSDPLRRAAYLLELKGQAAAVDRDQTIADPVLLMEVLEAREALSEAESIDAIEKLSVKAGADAIHLLSEISKAFAADDLVAANRLTTRLKYLRKFLEETRARRVALEASDHESK
ncbi:MAG TPA: Fe-S protein assembly co-chaperone HscB [Dongiaceae bacterium]|nr:Fe-S protein assembly co-chaperone HscB [Dongiaceae bacterium]